MRHRWVDTQSLYNHGATIQQCANCNTQRVPDWGTKTMFLYRSGTARPPNGKPMPSEWTAYRAGVVPTCQT